MKNIELKQFNCTELKKAELAYTASGCPFLLIPGGLFAKILDLIKEGLL